MATGIKKQLTPLCPLYAGERERPYACSPLMFPYGVVRPAVYTAHERKMQRSPKNSFRGVEIPPHFRGIVPGTVTHFITMRRRPVTTMKQLVGVNLRYNIRSIYLLSPLFQPTFVYSSFIRVCCKSDSIV